MRGRAKPLQPGSSVRGPPTIKVVKKAGTTVYHSESRVLDGVGAPNATVTYTEAATNTAGRTKAAAYHLSPTRQRTIAARRAFTPVLPAITADTIIAATIGLQGRIAVESGLSSVKGHGHQARPKANTK
jgi:hypothetical protein